MLKGCGISESSKKYIFQPFMQADDSITRRYGGTGLGLSISKKLVEYMGGHMWFESELNHGTIFYFTVETQRVGNSDIQQPTSPDTQILIIGDNSVVH
jgi:two-component system sensor histidine kinase/response regulator